MKDELLGNASDRCLTSLLDVQLDLARDPQNLIQMVKCPRCSSFKVRVFGVPSTLLPCRDSP